MQMFITPAPCRQCFDREAVLDKGDTLFCAHCGAQRGRLSGRTTTFVEAVVKRFGQLDQPVRLHQKEAAPD